MTSFAIQTFCSRDVLVLKGKTNMSDASLPHRKRCGRVEYDCACDDSYVCSEYGRELKDDEIATGRRVCFRCYSNEA